MSFIYNISTPFTVGQQSLKTLTIIDTMENFVAIKTRQSETAKEES
jgi:hypothetical protein